MMMEPKRELLIRWNAAGTHAEIRRARPDGVTPSGVHRLAPGDSYFAIPYELWAEWEGRTADALHLQALAQRDRSLRPAVPIAARLSREGWRAEAELDDHLMRPGDLHSEYGFTTGTRLVECSREQLIAQCVSAPETPRVWTPEARELVPPERVSFLADALRRDRQRSAERGVTIASVAVVVTLGLSLGAGARSGWAIMSGLAAAWLALALFHYRHVRSAAGSEAFAAAREEFRHAAWIGGRRPLHTELLLAVLVVVFFGQSLAVADAVAAAGLVKSDVRDGEIWRLLTGPLLHGGVLHLGMNGLALWSLGPLVEAHSRRAFLSLLFLISALCGSVLSLLLLPDATSVGASGGILGIAGYLLLLGYRRREAIPRGFVQRLGGGILATAVLGIVGHAWVDNATHLGGLFAGMLLAIVVESRSLEESPRATRAAERLGILALVVLLAAGAASLAAMHLR